MWTEVNAESKNNRQKNILHSATFKHLKKDKKFGKNSCTLMASSPYLHVKYIFIVKI